MDFKDILDTWEGRKDRSREYEKKLKEDLETEKRREKSYEQAVQKKNLEKMQPQDRIDLHGLKESEAMQVLSDFLHHSIAVEHKKVLVIHGKGYHSNGKPVLKRAVHLFLESAKEVLSFGPAPVQWGGTGAVVVFLRSRKS